MSDFIELTEKYAAVMLADTQSYAQTAKHLGLSISELKAKIESLESKLCLYIFELRDGSPSLTQDGFYLIEQFREVLSRRGGT